MTASRDCELALPKHRCFTEDKIRALFTSIDRSHKGWIDQQDIQQNIFDSYSGSFIDPASNSDRADHPLRQSYSRDLMKVCDTSMNSQISIQEFTMFLLDKEKELWQIFCQMDATNDGELSTDDVRFALTKAGVPATDAELAQFFSHIDRDEDGVISFDEWVDFLLFMPHITTMQNVFQFYQDVSAMHRTDSGEQLIIPAKSVDSVLTTKYLIAGGVAGAISRSCTAPIDRLKVLLQISTHRPKNASIMSGWKHTLHLIKSVYNDGGVMAFWKGNGVNVVKIVPESAVRFYIFETVKRYLSHTRSHKQHTELHGDKSATIKLHTEVSSTDRFIAGGLAGLVSQLSIYPLETIKTRMMAEMNPNRKPDSPKTRVKSIGAIDIARKMYVREGWRSFFRGLGPSLIGIVPYAGIDLTAYETFKIAYIKATGEQHPSPWLHMVCGGASGALSASIVYPIGLVRTRLQAQGASMQTQMYPGGTMDVIRTTYKNEGLKGFYRGLVPNLVKVVPAVSLTYISYEQAKRYLKLS